MSESVISVENLSKSYLIGHQGPRERYQSLRDTLSHHAKSFSRRTIETLRGKQMLQGDSVEEFWALKDISFEVKQGEVLGIIGRNGAGKSTLLKVLSRITEPTSGRVTIEGRVASLLEVGTGFHPELSGRENIFLNGAILGMSRCEIKAKFDEIVDFAGVEKFLDTPVKRYSSGMYVRLAFAVAAHLEPEILIVDEVLAVGDAEFQEKCLGKMENVAKNEGKTILFVSHNISAVTKLCGKALMLETGLMTHSGSAADVAIHYLSKNLSGRQQIDLRNYSDRSGNGNIRFIDARLVDQLGHTCEVFNIGENVEIQFTIARNTHIHSLTLAIELSAEDGSNIANMIDVDSHFSTASDLEKQTLAVQINDIRFYPGIYYIGLFAGSKNGRDTYDHLQKCLSFRVDSGGSMTMRSLPRSAGLLYLTPQWTKLS
jgi:lipopolysaccharide transport system ATP-binding protein